VSTQELGVVEENGARKGDTEEGVDRLVALGRALSDPGKDALHDGRWSQLL
jgi:hypothetical protein